MACVVHIYEIASGLCTYVRTVRYCTIASLFTHIAWDVVLQEIVADWHRDRDPISHAACTRGRSLLHLGGLLSADVGSYSRSAAHTQVSVYRLAVSFFFAFVHVSVLSFFSGALISFRRLAFLLFGGRY